MPAKKDSSLHTRHDSKADRAARDSAEESMRPTTKLTSKHPALLNGHSVAIATWKRVMKLYLEIKGEIITAFDEDLLVKYCLAEEELIELSDMRREIMDTGKTQLKALSKFSKVLEKFAKKLNAEDLDDYYKALDVAAMALASADKLVQKFLGTDARLDAKRKMLLAMEQSLYLTPRSRAGVAPEEREPDEPQSDMDKLIDGDKKGKT